MNEEYDYYPIIKQNSQKKCCHYNCFMKICSELEMNTIIKEFGDKGGEVKFDGVTEKKNVGYHYFNTKRAFELGSEKFPIIIPIPILQSGNSIMVFANPYERNKRNDIMIVTITKI